MIVKLTNIEYGYLIGSSIACEYCEELLKIYEENNYFDTDKLTRQQLIHIETTTRRTDLIKHD